MIMKLVFKFKFKFKSLFPFYNGYSHIYKKIVNSYTDYIKKLKYFSKIRFPKIINNTFDGCEMNLYDCDRIKL